MTYTVKYKNIKSNFWKTIKKVKGDGIMEDSRYPTRYFVLDNEERIEIPIPDNIFHFSQERFLVIKQNAEKSLGSDLKINK